MAAVEVVPKDGFAAVATIHDVIDRSGVFDAKFASHVGTLWNTALSVNAKTCDYAGLTRMAVS